MSMAEARAAAAETPAATAAGGSRDAAAEDAAPMREAGEERAGRPAHAREEEVVHPLPPAGKAQAGKGGPRASNSSNMEQIASTRVNTLVRQQNDSTKKFRVSDVLESTMGVSEYHKELHRLPTTIHEEISLPPSQALNGGEGGYESTSKYLYRDGVRHVAALGSLSNIAYVILPIKLKT